MSFETFSSSCAGVLGHDLLEPPLEGDRLTGVDLDVRRLPLEAAPDLVDQDLGVRQRHPLSFRAAGEQERAHRHRDADADRLHVRLDELHRVVDREPVVDRAARRVDVDRDVLVRVLGLEVEELGDDQVRDLVVDGRAEEDDPLVEQARVDVERALAARGLLDHHRDQRAHGSSGHAGSLLPGVHSFVSVWGFSLSGVQSLSRASASSTGIALHLGGDAVERRAQAQVVAQRARGGRSCAELLDQPRRRRRPPRSACSRMSSSTSSSETSMPSCRRPPRARARAATELRGLGAHALHELLGGLAGQSGR